MSVSANVKSAFAKIGPAVIIVAMILGVGSIGSVLLAGASLGYDAFYIVLLTGILGPIVYYAGGKVRVMSNESPAKMIAGYTNNFFTYILFTALLLSVYFVVIAGGFILLELTEILADISGATLPSGGVAALVVLQILAAAAIVVLGFSSVKAALSLLVVMLAVVYTLNVFVIGIDAGQMATGIVPTDVPDGIGAIGLAGVIGGAFGTGPIWYAYLVDQNNWTIDDLNKMAWDLFIFVGVVFTITMSAIYLSASATLTPDQAGNAISAAFSLEPIAGEFASVVFIAGLYGASFTSIIGTPLIATYAVADIFNQGGVFNRQVELSIDDPITRNIAVGGILSGILGIFLGGQAFVLIAIGLGLFNLVGPIMIAVFGFALYDHVSDQSTVFWLIMIGLGLGFMILMYGAYLSQPLVAVATLAGAIFASYKIINDDSVGSDSELDQLTIDSDD